VFNDRLDGGARSAQFLCTDRTFEFRRQRGPRFPFQEEKKDGPVLTAALNVFNILNHPNYVTYIGVIGPDGGPRNPNFGFPASAYPGRRFQLNLECKF
jgi:hypothetical protein